MIKLNIDPDSSLLTSCDYHPSPNHNTRPFTALIDLIVIHNISLPPGEFQTPYVDDLFMNRLDVDAHAYFKTCANLSVSCHVFIDREGRMTQYVPFTKRAWHAGESSFRGRPECNDYSIGIELEGTDQLAYTYEQYQQLRALTQCLMLHYPAIAPDRITGHSDIAPGRKTDPGPSFDWHYFRSLLTCV